MKNEKVSNIILVIVCFILIGVIAILYDKAFLSNEVVIKSNVAVADNNYNKTIAIMYETGVESGEYVASDETTWPTENYVFNEDLSKCENGSSISYDGTNVKVLASRSDRCYVYFDREVITLANYIKRLCVAENEGTNGLYLHDGEGSYGELEAGDNSYRYAGASEEVNNYICLGSDEATCPDANTFRIIGVFNDQIKVIKATSYGTYYWSGSESITNNAWGSSTLNTTTLNSTYLNSLVFSSSIVAPSEGWQVGGNTNANIRSVNVKTAYINEIISPAESIIDTTSKIGLMYVSDYMYAASPTYWSYVGFNSSDETADYRAAKSSNWLALGSSEWTISRNSDDNTRAFSLGGTGSVDRHVVSTVGHATRPVFYLSSSVILKNGVGELSEPYRIM